MKVTPSRPELVSQPETRRYLQRGIDQISKLIEPTLGPISRTVVVAPVTGSTPEVLDEAGLIARRAIQLQNRHEDVGAMFLRGVLWTVFEQANDGVATACVLFKSIFDGAMPLLASGLNAELVRQGLHHGQQLIVNELERMSRPAIDPETLKSVSQTVTRDDEVASLVSGVFADAGMFGHIEVRDRRGGPSAAEFINGSVWKSPNLASSTWTDSGVNRIDVERCAVFVSDLDITDEQGLAHLVRCAEASGAGGLLLIARSIANSCATLLRRLGTDDFPITSVRTPDLMSETHHSILLDLEVLTGAKGFHTAAGDSLVRLTVDRLGHARYAWADRGYFGLVGGGGDPWSLRQHINQLKEAFSLSSDPVDRERLVRRISRLIGSTAVVWTDGSQRRAVERATSAVRASLLEGVVPGGGVALLACQSALDAAIPLAACAEHTAAYRLLHTALEVPIRTMLTNAGKDPASILHAIREQGTPHCWDGHSDRIVDSSSVGILDPLSVVRCAVQLAVEGAAQALTIDTIVHRRQPTVAVRPSHR